MKLISPTDVRLHKPCGKIPEINAELESIVKDMFQIAKEFKGLGLAAPQIGLEQRFFIINHGGQKIVCINPQIIEFSEQVIILEEGCLTYPDQYVNITRPKDVKVTYTDLKGKKVKTRFHEMKSRVFQHEFDHLCGITFYDRAQSEIKINQTVSTYRKADMT